MARIVFVFPLLSMVSLITAQQMPNMHMPGSAPYFGMAGGIGDSAFYDMVDNLRYDKETQNDKTLLGFTQRSVRRGAERAISHTAQVTLSQGLSFVPAAMKNITSLLSAYAYKLAYGTMGLTWAKLALLSEDIKDALINYTTNTVGGTTRDERIGEINQETSNQFVDKNWNDAKKEIKQKINETIAELSKALPCYNLIFYNARHTGIKRFLGNWAHALSSKDNDFVSKSIVQTIRALNKLYELIDSFKAEKEAKKGSVHIKLWLGWALKSFRKTGIALEGDNVGKTNANTGPLAFPTLNGGSLQNLGMPTNDLFGSSNALAALGM